MSYEPKDPAFAQRVRDSFHRQGFMHLIGARLVTVEPGFCEIQVDYRRELSQQHGYFHAGIIGTLADNAGGYAAYSLMPEDSSVLTVEYKLNLMAPGDGERLTARSKVLKAGRTLTICRSEVYAVRGEREQLCAVSLMTMMAMIGKPDLLCFPRE